ncbi:PhzF family phenazine biosynthesis protein [Halalkalibacter alkalisediminis]|uniref:PhzF family phenazine biosynthesis protein n=1 Tax=Halalkalibacter alkalisediminis TaxID=935616 RepID=UPI00235DDD2A|nr:PhzF family phenazine biosynthesis protein [Halalkalibacter alkalisediminis]
MLEGILDPTIAHHFKIAQGHSMRRPGDVNSQISNRKGTPVVKVGGQAVTMIAGELQVH